MKALAFLLALFAASAANAQTSVFTATLPGSDTAGWVGYSQITVFQPGALGAGGASDTQLRVTFQTTSGTNGSLGAAWVCTGVAGSTNCAAAPTQLKFAGATSKAVSGAMTFVSDGVPFTYDSTKPLVIQAYWPGTTVNLAVAQPFANVSTYYGNTAGNCTGVLSPSSACGGISLENGWATSAVAVSKVETLAPAQGTCTATCTAPAVTCTPASATLTGPLGTTQSTTLSCSYPTTGSCTASCVTASSGPPYPAFLTSKGVTNYRSTFNPDLTLPITQVLGPDCVGTPLCYSSMACDGRVYLRGSDAARQGTGTWTDSTGLHLLHSNVWSTTVNTLDNQFRGHGFKPPFYYEVKVFAHYDLTAGGDDAYYTMWTMGDQGFRGNQCLLQGQSTYNEAEIDGVEAYSSATRFGPGRQWQKYASTVVPNTNGAGPDVNVNPPFSNTYGLNQPHVDPNVYGVPAASPADLWERDITWGIWYDGTNVIFVRDGVQIWTGPAASQWTNPNPPNGNLWGLMMMMTDNPYNDLPFPTTYSNRYDIRYIRVWQP